MFEIKMQQKSGVFLFYVQNSRNVDHHDYEQMEPSKTSNIEPGTTVYFHLRESVGVPVWPYGPGVENFHT